MACHLGRNTAKQDETPPAHMTNGMSGPHANPCGYVLPLLCLCVSVCGCVCLLNGFPSHHQIRLNCISSWLFELRLATTNFSAGLRNWLYGCHWQVGTYMYSRRIFA